MYEIIFVFGGEQSRVNYLVRNRNYTAIKKFKKNTKEASCWPLLIEHALFYSKTVWALMSVCRASSALSTSLLRNLYSSLASRFGLPSGCGIAIVGTIRLAPTVLEIGTTVHM